MGIRNKMMAISAVLLLVPGLIVGTTAYYTANEGLNESGETTIENAVTMALMLIDSMDQQVEAGTISLDDAQEQVREYLMGEAREDGTREITTDIDLGENGYFVIYDEEGTEILHPSLEGENVWDVQDEQGRFLVQDQIQAAQEGGGFTFYSWEFPNDPDRVGEKIMYNELDPNWDWVVTAGSYMEDYNAASNAILWTVVWTLSGALILGGVAIFFFARSISRPVGEVRDQLKAMSDNNLVLDDLPEGRKDEFGDLARSMNQMKGNTRNMVERIIDYAGQLASSSEQLTASSEETTKATEQVTESISTISESSTDQSDMANAMQEDVMDVSEVIARIQANMKKVNDAVEDTTSRIEEGKHQVDDSSEKMTLIQEQTSTAAASIHELGKKSQEIEGILGLITDISEQTNLLALNAAIEAARAGEHGKGFAVVADEVRKLAEESNQSAGKISRLVEEIQQDISKATHVMKENEARVDEGRDSIALTGEAFDKIASSKDTIVSMSGEVSKHISSANSTTGKVVEAVMKTVQGVEETSQEVASIASSAEEQTASMEEVASAAAALSQIAEDLDDIVHVFKT
ncbi:methyl-accepting chemotaxis protein [Salisediminibacterium selenitireducens]|uniref:Methyl-accepting chemotaxis sensory transducer with Cache sensor n=1 Tax=Bacillus selenitireducens (strain ATCC 700615 / DSM 15326 / MLS10) TaxID=439292 RepID=D6Y0W6_BACIE|nr:methyl-accepting chemotaxis protein [Salisediminibacterium selenitireducens]ADI00684.1 methyl-accepting chemotaxis sensory transducer with Cache sensor [[Bacillus] selenitireducens MLS10]